MNKNNVYNYPDIAAKFCKKHISYETFKQYFSKSNFSFFLSQTGTGSFEIRNWFGRGRVNCLLSLSFSGFYLFCSR